MNWPTLALRILVMGFLLPFLYSQNPFLIDSSRSSLIPQSISNSIQIADINNDGFNDIIYSGYDQTRNGLFIDVIHINSEGEFVVRLNSKVGDGTITYPQTDETLVAQPSVFTMDKNTIKFDSNEITFDRT